MAGERVAHVLRGMEGKCEGHAFLLLRAERSRMLLYTTRRLTRRDSHPLLSVDSEIALGQFYAAEKSDRDLLLPDCPLCLYFAVTVICPVAYGRDW